MRHASQLLILALALAATPALGKSSDRNQPMDISADRTDAMLGDDSVSTLEGNVRIRQGTLEVDAARAEVIRAAGEINRIVLTGAPAVLRQVSDAGEPMEATAGRIVYMLGDETMMLTGNVVITQPRGTLRGETIKYDINTGRLDGGGDGARVQMRILPKSATAN
ncbi:lipopolysaccharide transport periplasmic protein LptA [Arenimonas caeni]|jgi:lipopolysaccharide export system protein LptA|uniref:Lipopolysaccharide export system protein LptA n=1 Tax=Arenimonas caeni TaxID=2058085 RepID=A0A2P6MBR6_9GAMM|nr:lipopolysaccharide transport periplasmic protein LptA [Arenimonas caeni]MDY0022517.1 lipopolysaccharide transport periplasmic protein LptA [Arenimonas caeni]PRH83437.1 lipopolysaccharide transport periplasmic protein LptA [Arenimonas caeni]